MSGIGNEICQLDAVDLAKLIRARRLSAVEVMRAHLDRITAVNPKVNAIVTLFANQVLAEAQAADESVAAGAVMGPLHGVPFTAKDSLDGHHNEARAAAKSNTSGPDLLICVATHRRSSGSEQARWDC